MQLLKDPPDDMIETFMSKGFKLVGADMDNLLFQFLSDTNPALVYSLSLEHEMVEFMSQIKFINAHELRKLTNLIDYLSERMDTLT